MNELTCIKCNNIINKGLIYALDNQGEALCLDCFGNMKVNELVDTAEMNIVCVGCSMGITLLVNNKTKEKV